MEARISKIDLSFRDGEMTNPLQLAALIRGAEQLRDFARVNLADAKRNVELAEMALESAEARYSSLVRIT